MFRSPLENELLARERMETLQAAYARPHPAAPHGDPALARARHGLGRGLIALGERLAETSRQRAAGDEQAAAQLRRVTRAF